MIVKVVGKELDMGSGQCLAARGLQRNHPLALQLLRSHSKLIVLSRPQSSPLFEPPDSSSYVSMKQIRRQSLGYPFATMRAASLVNLGLSRPWRSLVRSRTGEHVGDKWVDPISCVLVAVISINGRIC
jgi:hypothetical protein